MKKIDIPTSYDIDRLQAEWNVDLLRVVVPRVQTRRVDKKQSYKTPAYEQEELEEEDAYVSPYAYHHAPSISSSRCAPSYAYPAYSPSYGFGYPSGSPFSFW